MRKIWLVVLFTALSVMPAQVCRAEGVRVNRVAQTVKGQVIDIDDDKQIIVVKWFDNINIVYDEIAIIAGSDTRVTKGAESIGFMELNQFDNVDVEYYDDGFSGFKAVSINVMM